MRHRQEAATSGRSAAHGVPHQTSWTTVAIFQLTGLAPNMTKITDNSNELSFHQLTSTSSILLIPLFQRAYVWSQKQLDRMLKEIEAITSGKESTRFLGSVIAVSRDTNPSEPTPREIVDGQQRLTTLYLFLLGAAFVAARAGKDEYARGLISTNLIVEWAQQIPVNTKLQPSIADRAQFNAILNRVASAGSLADWLPLKLKLPPTSGIETGPLARQFERVRLHLQKTLDSPGGFEALNATVEVVRNSMTFVFILLKDAGSATTVFEGLNDPGVPIAVGDLVKNEVFARIGYNEHEARVLHDNRWEPFRKKFGEFFNDYFFPFSVIHKPTTSQTEMFGELRTRWKELTADKIIDDLDRYSGPYLALNGNEERLGSYVAEVRTSLSRIVRLKPPAAIFPFVMQLLDSFAAKQVGKEEVARCLSTLESFLVRRALCGIEPTGLLGLFRTMWTNLNGQVTAPGIQQVILKRLTIEWPADARVREAIRTRPLYGSAIAPFVVMEYDRAQSMDHPATAMSIEHVMPQTYCEAWKSVVEPNQHGKLKHLWANLVPCSSVMNTNVAQSPYPIKRKVFEKESMFASTRKLATDYDTWGEAEILARSERLADWAIDHWKRPQES